MRRLDKEAVEMREGRVLTEREHKMVVAFDAIMEASKYLNETALAARVFAVSKLRTKRPSASWREHRAQYLAELRGLVKVINTALQFIPRR